MGRTTQLQDTPMTNNLSALSGILLKGKISARSKRDAIVRNQSVEIVTYTIEDQNNHRNYYVDDFDPSSYFDVGEEVLLPIYIKPYRKKTGDPSYVLNIQKEYHSSRGIAF